MKIKIEKGVCIGHAAAPPSKSMAHRMLICAGLAEGTSVLRGISDSEDMLATLDCLTALGAVWKKDGTTVTVEGVGEKTEEKKEDEAVPKRLLPCRESGSTLRFFIPICLRRKERITLTGSKRLMERPLGVYQKICEERGLLFLQKDCEAEVQGPLHAGVFEIPGDISSQFVSGLLLALPTAEGDSVISIRPPIESRPYIDMTLAALRQFGVEACWKDAQTLHIPGGQRYRACDAQVEGDFSNAAFFGALQAIQPENRITIEHLPEHSLQADRVFPELLLQLDETNPCIDLSDCPDLGPILFAAAAAKHGARFIGTKRLKIKESDRGQAMAQELRKFGVDVIVDEDEIKIAGSGLKAPQQQLDGHNDHRIVMSEAVLLTLTGGVIDGAEAVAKSFPDFFDKLRALGIEVKEIEN